MRSYYHLFMVIWNFSSMLSSFCMRCNVTFIQSKLLLLRVYKSIGIWACLFVFMRFVTLYSTRGQHSVEEKKSKIIHNDTIIENFAIFDIFRYWKRRRKTWKMLQMTKLSQLIENHFEKLQTIILKLNWFL